MRSGRRVRGTGRAGKTTAGFPCRKICVRRGISWRRRGGGASVAAMGRTILLGFVAGFVAVLVFHQGTAFLLHHVGNGIPASVALFGQVGPPFSLAPVPPFGLPAVLSASFWGGVWGIVLAVILERMRPPALLTGFVFGALALTLVAFTLVASLKGVSTFAGGNMRIWARAGLFNGAWGFGTALLLRPLRLRA